MTLDQYLSSKGITSEQIRANYEERAEQDLKLEFFLRKVAEEEKITVETKDIEEALGSIEDPKQQQEIAQNPYLVASIIRQQKTLDFLSKI
jgi:FKBP-type peptidyl-prolyl cis-trans isomerase (trigger factor)